MSNTEDFSQYFNTKEDISDNKENTTTSDDGIERNDITPELFSNFTNRLSGIDNEGISKSMVSYQCYEEGDYDNPQNAIRSLSSNVRIQIAINKKYPDLILIDFCFQSPDNTEIKLFWLRIQDFIKKQAEQSDKNWIFYINILERAGITYQTQEEDLLLSMNIYNPIICYLTREVPNARVKDEMVGDEMVGGNIVRMLVPTSLVYFENANVYDTNEIKGEVQREQESARYINNI